MIPMTPPQVSAAIEAAIAALSRGLTTQELSENWNEEARQIFLTWMLDLRSRSIRNELARDECMSIIRNLDYWAIHVGRLRRTVLAVQRAWPD